MASYYRETEREGLPSIRRNGFLESHVSKSKRITTLDDDIVRCQHRSTSPVSKKYDPRPPSPTHSKRHVNELQEQVRAFKDELRKKESLIQQLVSMDAVAPKVPVRSVADTVRHETMFMGDRHAVETARSELASLQVKYDKIRAQMQELEAQLEVKDIKIREFKTMYETSKESESRLSAMLESHRIQIMELEGKAGSYESAVGRSEFTVSALQQQSRESQNKVVELESRIRNFHEEREKLETELRLIEMKHGEMMTQLSGILRIDDYVPHSLSADDIVLKITDVVQENALLRGKIVTLNETLNSTELESKASRETIMRLVSEVGKEQKVATRYTSELDNIRMERDSYLSDRRSMERELDLMKERLIASQNALDAAREELDMKQSRYSSIEREYRTSAEDIRKVHTDAHLFKEQLASLLSTYEVGCELSEESIKRAITIIQQDNRDFAKKYESMEDRVKTLTEELENQFELHKTASHRARKLESEIVELQEKLRIAEGELSAGDVLRDEFRCDKEKYLRSLQRLGERMKMDRITSDLGFDMTLDALESRAEQLVKLEQGALADKTTHVYNLQRKVKSLKDQLESKDLHIDLMRKKMTSLEEKMLGKSVIERERDSESFRVRKLEKVVEKYKVQLHDAKHEITNLKAQLLGSSDLKLRTLEQRKEIEELAVQVEELENLRKRQSSKIKHMKGELECTVNETKENRAVSSNAVQALSSELRTSKNALNAIQNREKQLLDFRNVVARMLGLDMNTLAVPDYEIISRLEKLIQAHHSHAFTTMSMEEALFDMEDGFLTGGEDYQRTIGNSDSNAIRRARERVKRKAARARARSASPTRRDPRSY